MSPLTDESTLILTELQELVDAPKECEHSTHGLPDWTKFHDSNGAKWFLTGTHSCGRTTHIYACDSFVTAGLAGGYVIMCSQCGAKTIPFKDFYSVRTRIST